MAGVALLSILCLATAAGAARITGDKGVVEAEPSRQEMLVKSAVGGKLFKGQCVSAMQEIVMFTIPICIKLLGSNSIGSVGQETKEGNCKFWYGTATETDYGVSADKPLMFKDGKGLSRIPAGTIGRVLDPNAKIPHVSMASLGDGEPEASAQMEEGQLLLFEDAALFKGLSMTQRTVFVPHRLPSKLKPWTLLEQGTEAKVIKGGEDPSCVVVMHWHVGLNTPLHKLGLVMVRTQTSETKGDQTHSLIPDFVVDFLTRRGLPHHWFSPLRAPAVDSMIIPLTKNGLSEITEMRQAKDEGLYAGSSPLVERSSDVWVQQGKLCRALASCSQVPTKWTVTDEEYTGADSMAKRVVAESLSFLCHGDGIYTVQIEFAQGLHTWTMIYHPLPHHLKTLGDQNTLLLLDGNGNGDCLSKDNKCGQLSWVGPVESLTSTLMLNMPDMSLWEDAWKDGKKHIFVFPNAATHMNNYMAPRQMFTFEREWIV